MKRLLVVGLLLLSAGGLLFSPMGCSGPVEVDEPGPCDGNVAPRIGELTWLVDEWDDPFDKFIIMEPDSGNEDDPVFLRKSDTAVLWFRYYDPDCNLDEGKIYWSIDQDRFAPVETIQLPPQRACDGMYFWQFVERELENGDEYDVLETEDLSPGFGYLIPEIKLQNLACGLHEVTLGVSDGCGKASTKALTTSFLIPASECF